MAAKSKKRLSKIENKLQKLEELEIKDVVCSICHSILIEPVTLPCYHAFCKCCFNLSIQNNSLCCPLCRLRIGSWLRLATKQKNLVNLQLWNYMKNNFSREIEKKYKGEDLNISEEIQKPRLSYPGEIREEYEKELKRLRAERRKLEQTQLAETELLIKKLQSEEDKAQKKYLERLKQDEILAKQIKEADTKSKVSQSKRKNSENPKLDCVKPRLKSRRIDAYLSKLRAPVKESPLLLTDDNTSSDGFNTKVSSIQSTNKSSPEVIPSCGKLHNNYRDKRTKNGVEIWNKENGEGAAKTHPVEGSSKVKKESDNECDKSRTNSQSTIQSLLVSLPLPYTGILQHKNNAEDIRNLETGSVDSMQQELCYFKPIDGSTPINLNKTFPVRVPSVRAEQKDTLIQQNAPSRDQYVDGLCRLRSISLEDKLPSAFAIALNILRVKKETPRKTVTRSQNKRNAASPNLVTEQLTLKLKKNVTHKNRNHAPLNRVTKLNTEKSLRRTRSMESGSKNDNEVTPKKKLKDRKVSSDRKLYLRSYSKKPNTKSDIDSPPIVTECMINNNNKVNLAVKNLSSPLDNCDVKNILREQIRIEKLIEQEKSDFELAQKMDAEWNGRRQLRRAASKRQLSINNYVRTSSKKLKV